MAVNRHQAHLVVYLEDRPYREIMNGLKNLPKINAKVLDIKQPAGGWVKVFDTLAENLRLLDTYQKSHVLLLMDFDGECEGRKQRLHHIITGHACADRVFMLGIDNRESEDLKRTLKQSNNEAIAAMLLEDCPKADGSVWQNTHLQCNAGELRRMRERGVMDWLFLSALR